MADPANGDPDARGAAPIVEAYDAALFDLDGVVYLGPAPVPGAAEGLAALRARGTSIGFVTNNAARTAAAVAAHLVELGVRADEHDVVTSGQAGARLLAASYPERGRVLVVGTAALADEVRSYGFTVVATAEDDPVAVLQGYDPDLSWPLLNEAGFALQRGARWFVTNTDPTRPTDRGLVPGAGSQIGALSLVAGQEPSIAGKPYRPLMDETVQRLGAVRPVFVGDRTDTDIAGAVAAGMDSMLVFSGSHGPLDLLVAPREARPTHVGDDLTALLGPRRSVVAGPDGYACGAARATITDGAVSLDGRGLDALWALAHLVWQQADAGHPVDPATALQAWRD